jgi:acyl carrier protein
MGLDSVELIMDVEKHFSISIPDAKAEKAHTVGQLVDCVAEILGVDKYDFEHRDKTFNLLKEKLGNLLPELQDFSITAKVSDTMDIHNKSLIGLLENSLNLKLTGFEEKGFLRNALERIVFYKAIDLRSISWKRYIDIILAHNLQQLETPLPYTSKYEIYIAIMRITVDKIGVDYQEIGLEKSFTDDLGVD